MYDSMLEIDKIIEKQVIETPTTEMKILNAAIMNFANKGYHNTKTKDIAIDAKIAEGTIFRYFKTKEDILLKLFPLAINIVVPKMISDLKKKLSMQGKLTLDELSVQVIYDRLLMIHKNERLIRAILPELFYRPVMLEQVKQLIEGKIKVTLLELIDYAGIESNEIDIPHYFRFVKDTLVGEAIHMLLIPSEFPLDSEEKIRQWINSNRHGWRKDDESKRSSKSSQ